MKAFLGIGLLGNGFVRAMLKKSDKVQVWNRTASKAKELEEYGAKAFDGHCGSSASENSVRRGNEGEIASKLESSASLRGHEAT